MLYDVTLKIEYAYASAADASRQIMRLMPLDIPGEQRLVAGTQAVNPKPQEWLNRTDFFGNRSVEIAYTKPHRDIVFTMQARVERSARAAPADTSPALEEIGAEIDKSAGLDAMAPHHFLGASPRVKPEKATTGYARSLTAQALSIQEAVIAIGKALHDDMTYDAEATTVDTPMLEAFEGRRGVCQDFTHIMIACLRGIGIPAGYVSGFLRTTPPPGKPRLEGADAMHAWVRAWCGMSMGWIEYDPTNAIAVGTNHIVVARGRDYSDVAPVKGMLRTSGDHTTEQYVDVIPLFADSA
jgi:transglutaminase-like putative cysteine protease